MGFPVLFEFLHVSVSLLHQLIHFCIVLAKQSGPLLVIIFVFEFLDLCLRLLSLCELSDTLRNNEMTYQVVFPQVRTSFGVFPFFTCINGLKISNQTYSITSYSFGSKPLDWPSSEGRF